MPGGLAPPLPFKGGIFERFAKALLAYFLAAQKVGENYCACVCKVVICN